MSTKNEQEILQTIVQKAWKDSVFKQNLINDPQGTIESFLGYPMQVPEGKNIAVVDQSNASTIYINIPAEPVEVEDMELDEAQLDVVTGGTAAADPPPVILITNPDGSLFGGGGK